MMMMMNRVMCVLAVVLCCACGYTMAAAATATNGQTKAVMASDQEKKEDDVFVFEEKANLPKGYNWSTDWHWNVTLQEQMVRVECQKNESAVIAGKNCSEWLKSLDTKPSSISGEDSHSVLSPVNDLEQVQEPPARPAGATGPTQETETRVGATSTQGKNQESTAASQSDQGASGNTTDNSTPAESNLTQQPHTAAPSASEETNSTTPPSPENTTTEAPTTTPSSPVTGTEISSIASAVQKNKANVDSSISPLYMRTAAPLLIVAALFSATVY
ncbi:uncharacterized protein TM35_000501130 [Trypanosoma theileri]|uniref:Mucin-like glycoprotein n=1 Tax=Trypanosoma theileri TaxID=67003 RepID=A0A1X0NIP6_9TRYP|nr:uncharacterized protein TM35_000501130 [Trypanosoma theileri]ORC84059.1 hypothetical protein TM35_000501130 [Trypanosoma theileri]